MVLSSSERIGTAAATIAFDLIKIDSEIVLTNFNESFKSDKTKELYNYTIMPLTVTFVFCN